MDESEKTFMKITNRNIYDKIEAMAEKNAKDHEAILLHQKETNGKVKLNRWISTTALTLVISIVFYLIGIK